MHNAPWGFCCFEDEGQTVFARITDGRWEKSFPGELRQALEALLPQRREMSSVLRDAVFLEALRDAALLVSLDPRACLRCKIRADQRDLAETLLCDLYDNALPALQFLPFAAGTEAPPAQGFQLLFLTDLPAGNAEGASVDFTAAQPALQLSFPRLGFAQRTLRALLPPLGLGLLRSMWDAAAQAAAERLGARCAAEYTDLTAWLMLRRNFSANEHEISEQEYAQLERRMGEYEAED